MLKSPFGELLPLITRLAVNGQTQFSILVLRLLEIARDFFDDVREILSVQVVVGLKKDFPQSRLADWVVLGIKLVEAMKRVAILEKSSQLGSL